MLRWTRGENGINVIAGYDRHGFRTHSTMQLAVNTYNNVVAGWCKFSYKQMKPLLRFSAMQQSVLLLSFQKRILTC